MFAFVCWWFFLWDGILTVINLISARVAYAVISSLLCWLAIVITSDALLLVYLSAVSTDVAVTIIIVMGSFWWQDELMSIYCKYSFYECM